MKLWLLSQSANRSYDTYDSVVVAAETADAARRIHPRKATGLEWSDSWECWVSTAWDGDQRRVHRDAGWAPHINDVEVGELGTTFPEMPEGVILASFNAG